MSCRTSKRLVIACVCFVGCLTLPLTAATPTTPGAGEMNAHFIDVGQGSSVLLEFACAAVLVDTGGEKNDAFDSTGHLTDYLDAFFDRRKDLKSTLSLVILTHPHIDHTRGLPEVMRKYKVQTLVDNGQETGSGGRQQKAAHSAVQASHGGIEYLAVTQRATATQHPPTLPAGLFSKCGTKPEFSFLWGALNKGDGWSKEVFGNLNDSSVVVRLQFGSTKFLLPGDIEEDVQSDLVTQTCPDAGHVCPLDVDIYHVAHHGSHNGTSSELLAAMSPKLAVISMGPFDRKEQWSAYQYGHPRLVTVNRLLDATTGVSGTRATVNEMLARRAKTGSGPQFVKTAIGRAIYGTGWTEDGNIVLAVKAGGTWNVLQRAGQ